MTTTKQIKEFKAEGINVHVADRKLAKELNCKHLRNGKISKSYSREGAGKAVDALKWDELGNVIALCKDGIIRQYIGAGGW